VNVHSRVRGRFVSVPRLMTLNRHSLTINATSHAQLRAYWLIMQCAAELARRDPADYDHFQSLLRRA
jgi:hypothetical protein